MIPIPKLPSAHLNVIEARTKNISIRHNTLDLLLDTLETRDNEGIVSDCVHSVSRLAGYLGVHVCCDMNVSNEARDGNVIVGN